MIATKDPEDGILSVETNIPIVSESSVFLLVPSVVAWYGVCCCCDNRWEAAISETISCFL